MIFSLDKILNDDIEVLSNIIIELDYISFTLRITLEPKTFPKDS